MYLRKKIFMLSYIYAHVVILSRNEIKNKWSNGRVAEGGTLLRCYVEQSASRVQIPITPFFKGFRAFYFF